MKLHDLRPADGSRKPRTRVGRGIAAGQGKTAGRGTKGQKARAGASIPPWFEGGQTPIHVRIPKLRGFKNRFRIDYEVVNIGRIAGLAEVGAFDLDEVPRASTKGKAPASVPITINQEILRAVGLVSTLNKPLKVLGHGDVSVPLFVVADAFSKSAAAKIEAAGGTVQILEIPSAPLEALRPEALLAEAATGDGDVAPAAAAPAPAAPAPVASQEAGADVPAPAPKVKRGSARQASAPVEAADSPTSESAEPGPVDASGGDA